MSSIERILTDQVLSSLKRYQFPPSRPLLVAFSGGPDSTALLEVLIRAAGKALITGRVSAVYINHRLRSTMELEEEEEAITASCSSRRIPLMIADLGEQTVYTRAKEQGESIEEAARRLRYDTLHEYAQGDAVLTAHTRDDQSETLIMRFFSGSGIAGLTGIPEQREPFYRPLLHTPKSLIMEFLEEQKIPYCQDSTNHTSVYRRNQLRELLPDISRVFPGFQRSLEALQQKMVWAGRSLSFKQADYQQIRGESREGTVSFPLSWFFSLGEYQRMEVVYWCWNSYLSHEDKPLPFDSIRPFLQWCEAGHSRKYSAPVFDVFQGRIEVKGEYVFWFRAVAQKEKKGYLKHVDAPDTPLYGGFYLCVRESDRFTPESLGLIQQELSLPLVVRSYKAGDEMNSTGGRKSLGKLFSDWKVPRNQRWMIPVIEDRNGIQAVLGAALGYHDRAAAAHTRPIQEGESYLLCTLEIIGSEA